MTTKRDLKSIICERQHKTGESYVAARIQVMRDRAQCLGIIRRMLPGCEAHEELGGIG